MLCKLKIISAECHFVISGTLSPALGVPQQPSHFHPFMRQGGPVIVPSPYAPQPPLVGPFSSPLMSKLDCMVRGPIIK